MRDSVQLPKLELSIQMLNLAITILNATHLKRDWFITMFELAKGYEIVFDNLIKSQDDERAAIMECLFQLSSLGASSLVLDILEVDKDSPFQQESFTMPIPLEGRAKLA